MRSAPVLLLAFAACTSFRESYREINNEELEGGAAPPIEGGVPVGTGHDAFESAPWKVVAFFKPT